MDFKQNFNLRCVMLPPPVGVVKVPSKRDQSKRILDAFHHRRPGPAVRVHALHLMGTCRHDACSATCWPDRNAGGGLIRLTCVSPAQLLAVKVKGQTVGKSKVIFHQDGPICPVHVGHFNFRPIPVPVCPVELPEARREAVSPTGRGRSQAGFLAEPYPYTGLVVTARGFTRSVSKRTRRWLPSSLETSTVSRRESVQKRRRATWSTAMPSGLSRSEEGQKHGVRIRTLAPRVLSVETRLSGTFSNDGADVSPAQAGPADGGRGDVAPVDHLLHTVEGHGDDHTVLAKEERSFVHLNTFKETGRLKSPEEGQAGSGHPPPKGQR